MALGPYYLNDLAPGTKLLISGCLNSWPKLVKTSKGPALNPVKGCGCRRRAVSELGGFCDDGVGFAMNYPACQHGSNVQSKRD